MNKYTVEGADRINAKIIKEEIPRQPKIQKRYSRVPVAEPIILEPED